MVNALDSGSIGPGSNSSRSQNKRFVSPSFAHLKNIMSSNVSSFATTLNVITHC